MSGVRYAAAARAELRKAAGYYEERSISVSRSFMAEVQRAVEMIGRFPESSQIARGVVRRKLLVKFPYSILYYVEQGAITIVAVMHHKQRPDYWAYRVGGKDA